MCDNDHSDFDGWKIVPDDGLIYTEYSTTILANVDDTDGVIFAVEIYWGSRFHGNVRMVDGELVLICPDISNIHHGHIGKHRLFSVSDKEVRINSALYDRIIEKIALLGG